MKRIKRCPLTKRIPRDFAKNIAKYAGMICILVCTISIGSSFQSVMDGAVKYLDDIKSENYQEDGFFETLNPINDKDIINLADIILNPEYLICVSHNTHNAIHYGDENLLIKGPVIRTKYDTCPWKR